MSHALPPSFTDYRDVPSPFSLVARNGAAASDNRIHSDDEARQFGYRAALVPGVTMYAYLTRLALAAFGRPWLEHGVASLACLRPVYAGETVTCSASRGEGAETPTLDLVCARPDGASGLTASVWVPRDLPPVDFDAIPAGEVQEHKRPLRPDAVPIGQPLAPLVSVITAETVAAYLAETDDRQSPYESWGLLPPAMLAGRQSRLIRHNFTLGPSIHVGSEIHHLGPAPFPAVYRTNGVIRETFERKGHHYLVLDALTTAGEHPVAHIRHTTIYQVRAT